MKIKSCILLCCFLFSFALVHAQYRVKKITAENLRGKDKTSKIISLNYSGDLLASIIVDNSTYEVRREKKRIIFGEKKKEYRIVEFNKEGISQIDETSFKYKNGRLEDFQYNIHRIKLKRKFDLFYNENSNLAVVATNPDDANANYLLSYNENSKCTTVEQGVDANNREVINAEWDENRLIKLSGYINWNSFVSNHEFIYDEHNNLVEEKIYELDKKNEQVLVYHCLIEYEAGKGDEKEIFFNFYNWKINLFFNHITFVPFIEYIY